MFYTKQELIDIGFVSVGEDTRISNKSVFDAMKDSSILTQSPIDESFMASKIRLLAIALG